eukprot:7967977-Prorocentrum_lima.AAC.1
MATPRTTKTEKEKKKAADKEAARERSIQRLGSSTRSSFSWWPGQGSEVFHTQTRLSGNRE